MSSNFLTRVLAKSRSTGIDRLVMLAIADLSDIKGEVDCEPADITRWANCSQDDLLASLRVLKGLREIEWTEGMWWMRVDIGGPRQLGGMQHDDAISLDAILAKLIVRDESCKLDFDIAYRAYVAECHRLDVEPLLIEPAFEQMRPFFEASGFTVKRKRTRVCAHGARLSAMAEVLPAQDCSVRWMRTREQVIKRDGCRCAYCGEVAEIPHIDHIIPRSRGGSDALKNLCVACQRCNSSKHDRTVEEWRESGCQQAQEVESKNAAQEDGQPAPLVAEFWAARAQPGDRTIYATSSSRTPQTLRDWHRVSETGVIKLHRERQGLKVLYVAEKTGGRSA